jgi:hypothetical protein
MVYQLLSRVRALLIAVILAALVVPLGDPHVAVGVPGQLNAAAVQASAPHPHMALAPGHRAPSIAGHPFTIFAFAAATWLLLAATRGALLRWQQRELIPPPGLRGRALLHAYLN